jgi:hypothetical protein
MNKRQKKKRAKQRREELRALYQATMEHLAPPLLDLAFFRSRLSHALFDKKDHHADPQP